jgi:hypothetical protein
MRAKVCANKGLARAGRADQQNIALRQLDFIFFGFFLVAKTLVVVVDRYRQSSLGRFLANHIIVKIGLDLGRRWQLALGVFASVVAGNSSRMISLHSSMHSSQTNTEGPAISFLTSC